MSRARKRDRAAKLDGVALVHMARQDPGLANYILDRRHRGIPAEGKRWQL